MTYPVMVQSYDSEETRLNGRQLDRATNGAAKVRSFFTGEKKTFSIVHPYVSTAEKVAFEAFYAANLLNSFTFRWAADGVDYTCLFGQDDPKYKMVGVGFWMITVAMVQA